MDIVEWLREKAKGFFKPTSTRLKEAADEIERLREALKECAKPFSGKALDYESAAYKLMNELERRIQISKAALQQKDSE